MRRRHFVIPVILSMTMLLTACGSTATKESKGSGTSSSEKNTSTSEASSSASETKADDATAPFAGNDTSAWRKAYLDRLTSEKILDTDNPLDYTFSFIYVDDDDIPELVCDTGVEAGGCEILTYHDGSVDTLNTARLNFSYIPKKNLLNNNDGHMGWYYDYVYTIKDGKWQSTFKGEYGEKNEAEDSEIKHDNATDRDIFPHYKIDDSDVSYEDYYKKLDGLYDSKKAEEPEHYYLLDDCKSLLENGYIASYGHKYELVTGDCDWQTAYKLAQNSGGCLASLTSDEEFDAVTKQIRDEGKTDYTFWIGMTSLPSYTNQDVGYYWTDPSLSQKSGTLILSHWYNGMPSYREKLDDGTEVKDSCVELIYRKSDDAFYFNDTVDDVITSFPSFAGHMGYIIEFNSAEDEKKYQQNSSAKDDGSGDYCHDLAKEFGNFVVAMSSGYPTEGSDYYSVPVDIYVSGEDAVDHTIGNTTVRIRKDAKVLYEDGQGDGPKLISLDEYANKLSAPDFKSCDQIRMWYDENAGADGTYQILYDDKGYVRQFYDGMFG